jgi:endogenous inhibitor of DNA gyrase (YacG/DUF329 family)
MGDAPLCVLCRAREVDLRYRPFCSERCRTNDLAAWADGRYRVAADPLTLDDTAAPDSVDHDADDENEHR